jgi:hypothetical protein
MCERERERIDDYTNAITVKMSNPCVHRKSGLFMENSKRTSEKRIDKNPIHSSNINAEN